MAINNNLVKQRTSNKPASFANYAKNPVIVKNVSETLGSVTKSKKFLASLMSAVSTNPSLQECDMATIVTAGLLGESLELSPSPQLGYYYMVPFTDNKNKRKVATFQLGYKGYLQLAIRSGKYKTINVLPIKEGELIEYNPLYETIEVDLIQNENLREQTPTIGYYAMFELTNGFRKAIYWSKEKMEAHALRYSNGYKAKKGYTFWEKDFDGMAQKTMLRQLLSKWGIMSIEMQEAFNNDNSFETESGEKEYIDTDFEEVNPAQTQQVVNEQPNKQYQNIVNPNEAVESDEPF